MPRWILASVVATVLLGNSTQGHAQATDHDVRVSGHGIDDSSASTNWRSVISGSLRLLLIEHTTRVAFQDKTRRELDGPFFGDYARSVRRPTGWSDGDGWGINYIGHPIHGAAAGFIFLASRSSRASPPGFSKAFWVSRGKAALWAGAYSLQFELGPLSEASIGNVGMHPGTTGWVDHVMTPVGALAFMVVEDWLDQYVIVRIESWTGNRVIRAVVRIALNPSRSFSVGAQGQMPWFRAGRPLQ